MAEAIEFYGWWSVDEKAECPEPWEHFKVVLSGSEAGDLVDAEDVADVLAASGYRLTLERLPAAAPMGADGE